MAQWAKYLYNYFGYANISIYDAEGYYIDNEGITSREISKDITDLQDLNRYYTIMNYNTFTISGYVDILTLTEGEKNILNTIMPFVEACMELK